MSVSVGFRSLLALERRQKELSRAAHYSRRLFHHLDLPLFQVQGGFHDFPFERRE